MFLLAARCLLLGRTRVHLALPPARPVRPLHPVGPLAVIRHDAAPRTPRSPLQPERTIQAKGTRPPSTYPVVPGGASEGGRRDQCFASWFLSAPPRATVELASDFPFREGVTACSPRYLDPYLSYEQCRFQCARPTIDTIGRSFLVADPWGPGGGRGEGSLPRRFSWCLCGGCLRGGLGRAPAGAAAEPHAVLAVRAPAGARDDGERPVGLADEDRAHRRLPFFLAGLARTTGAAGFVADGASASTTGSRLPLSL
jgi:hypothetical protein